MYFLHCLLTSINESFLSAELFYLLLRSQVIRVHLHPAEQTPCLKCAFPALLVRAPPPWACLDFSMPQGLLSPLDSLGTCCMHIACLVCNSHLALRLDHLGFLLIFLIVSGSFKNDTTVFSKQANVIRVCVCV